MDELKNNFKNNSLHHAYLLEGEASVLLPELLAGIESSGIKTSGNPDVVIGKYSTFTIADGRHLKARQIERAITGEKKFFIIQTDFLNTEAQHALLKVFEEPADNVHFFILTPRVGALIDTLLSRLVYVKEDNDTRESYAKEAGQIFLKQKAPERLKKVAALIKSHADDEESGALRADALMLLNEIESALYSDASMNALSDRERAVFEQIQKSRAYLSIPGASVKMLLEQISLLAPEK